jgi:CheY-like chemotaxis protein
MPRGGKLTIETGNAFLDDHYASLNEDVTAGQYVLLAVSDTGFGMSPEVSERAFEPFFTTKGPAKGTGLGLSMVYGFVKQSGGHMKIYSEVGQGTTVRLYFPRARRDQEVSERPAAAAAGLPGGKETILIVEDHPDVRATVVAQLGRMGYRLFEAANAADALALLERPEPVDLLFTDVVLPGGMSGRELAEVVRRLWPDLKVLFTSGYTSNAIVHQGRLDEGVDLLTKPYKRADLAHKVRQVLDRE